MDIIRAKNIVRDLAEGIDPRTGEFLPPDNIYNSPEVIRALFTLLEWTNSCIAQDPLRNAGKPWSDVEVINCGMSFFLDLKRQILLKSMVGLVERLRAVWNTLD